MCLTIYKFLLAIITIKYIFLKYLNFEYFVMFINVNYIHKLFYKILIILININIIKS